MKMTAAAAGIFTAIAFICATAFAGGIAIHPGLGRAKIEHRNLPAARAEALRLAMRNALDVAIAGSVPGIEYEKKRRLVEKSLLRRPAPYIVSYETIKDEHDDEFYEIGIEARFDVDRLRRVVGELGAPATADSGERRALVAIEAEKNKERERFSFLENELAERLALAGFDIASGEIGKDFLADETLRTALRGDFDAAAEKRDVLGVRFLLIGSGDFRHPTDNCPRDVTLFFVDLRAREVLHKLAYRLKPEAPCDEAAREAAAEIFEGLAPVIGKKNLLAPLSAGTTTVVFTGVRDFADIVRLREGIRSIAIVKDARMSAVATGGVVRFVIDHEGASAELERAFKDVKFAGLSLKKRETEDGRLTFRVNY
ncbi:hypothetical protein K8I61_00720 [bacterium]|nr:hypothetical protein [bacterium]